MPSEAFTKAASDVQNLPTPPSDSEKLQLYGLYKQATSGDNTSAKPGLLDFVGKAKWQAYEDNKGLSQEEAEEKYIQLVADLQKKYGA